MRTGEDDLAFQVAQGIEYTAYKVAVLRQMVGKYGTIGKKASALQWLTSVS